MILKTKDAQQIYADFGIMLNDVEAALVALSCNAQAEHSTKTSVEWAHIWAAAESDSKDAEYLGEVY
jgi:hypothetical protein